MAISNTLCKIFCSTFANSITLGQEPDVLSLLQDWIITLKDYDYKPTTINAVYKILNKFILTSSFIGHR